MTDNSIGSINHSMIENRTEIQKGPNHLSKTMEFLFGKDDPSEDIGWLLGEGKIEQLVQEGRTPLKIGTIGTVGEEMQAYYQIPPKGFDPKNIKKVYGSMGVYVFVHKLGKERIGSTFTLNDEQVEEMDQRIASVKQEQQ